MGIVDDLLRVQGKLAADRAYWEDVWRDCVDLAMPFASWKFNFGGETIKSSLTGTYAQPESARRSRDIYDGEAVWASERLAGGVESLVSPRSQKWQDFVLGGAFAPEPTDLEEEWLEDLRNYNFRVRYDPRCNFALANQKAIRSTVTLGTGILFLEENLGRKGIDTVQVPFFYRYVPVIEAYLGVDPYDDVDQCFRICEMTAKSAASYFGAENLSQKVRDSANDVKKANDTYTFLHAVLPREQVDEASVKREGQLFASYWAEIETKHLVRSSGFFTFPYLVQWWDQAENCSYGQSPLMSVLGDLKMLQVMSKTALKAAQQVVDPPMATMPGFYNKRLNLNPRAVNAGYLDESGRLKAQPIVTAQNPSFAENLMELKRQGIRRSMYVDLFQTLVEHPEMTATEAMIRANEKGELLGPAGAKIESSLGRAAEREIGIIQRKGAFDQGSPLEPPASMGGKNVSVDATGPLARLRRMQELQGVESVLQMASVLGQYDQRVLARIDADKTLELAREIRGAPRKMFRTDDEVANILADQEQKAANQANLMATETLAKAAGAATPAIAAMQAANEGRAA